MLTQPKVLQLETLCLITIIPIINIAYNTSIKNNNMTTKCDLILPIYKNYFFLPSGVHTLY